MLGIVFVFLSGAWSQPAPPPSFHSYLGSGLWSMGSHGMNLTFAADLSTGTTFAGVFKGGLVDFAFFVSEGSTSYMAVGPQVWPKSNCRSEPKNVYGLFSLDFVSSSSYSGPVFYSGKPASVYIASMDKCYGGVIPTYNCTAKTFVNGETILGVEVRGVMSGMPSVWSIVFDKWQADVQIPEDLMNIPSVCLLGSPGTQTCPLGPVQTFFTFKNQPGSDSIANENTADDLGEVSWLCMHGPKYPNNPFVSRFQVAANTTWGLYAQCNEGICMEASPAVSNTPGRQCPGCNDPDVGLGQCSANNATGSWLSWPREHLCAEGQSIGDECGWQFFGSDKTITVSCLEERGLFALCSNLAKATTIFNQAFDAENGCPNVA